MSDEWESTEQYGIRFENGSAVQISASLLQARRELERLQANGTDDEFTLIQRPILAGPWQAYLPAKEEPQPPLRQRKFVKETSKIVAPQSKTVVKKVVQQIDSQQDPGIVRQLFADPAEQLAYEIRHYYLMTVPLSQREQWPLGEYEALPRFMTDIHQQSAAVSRNQIIAACVDVVSGRVIDVKSRQVRQLHEGGGQRSLPVVVRGDGAMAWRANINSGAPGARRIMWWRLPSGFIQLARLAHHDDVDI